MENRRWARYKRMRTKRTRQEKGRVEERKGVYLSKIRIITKHKEDN
jgi:hypothetical protein